MSIKSQIDQVFIKWTVAGKQLLLINLNKSGAISRAGDGSKENMKRFFLGRTEPSTFEAFMTKIDEALFEMTGRYELPSPKGDISVLTVSFTGENLDTGFEFRYGVDSEGPPEEFIEIVEHALVITHSWWEEQLSRKKQNKK